MGLRQMLPVQMNRIVFAIYRAESAA